MSTGYVMTLANSIIGVGILAMPFCFQKCGILLSILLLIASNLITRLACHYLLKTSIKARRRNFEFLASYIFGSSGKLMVELCVIGYLIGTCITYFVVVGDLGPQIVAKLFSISQTDSLRTSVMVIVTLFCVIPLGLLKNIESLSFVCISSILFYFCLVIKIMIDSEEKITTSNWYDDIHWWRPSGITQCLPIFSMALSCQMQIFEIYDSLQNQSLEKMNDIVKFGTAICTGVYILVGSFGYIAFGDQQMSGNILISLSPSFASDIIKFGFVLSVAVSFPLVIFPCRASLYSLIYHRSHSDTAHYIPEHRFKYITISIIVVSLIIGILIPSIELVIGLVGSTIGVAICIMFPASCFIKMNKKNSTEKLAAQFLLVFGFLIMILGTYANLGALDEQQSNIPIERKPDVLAIKPNIIPIPDDLNKNNFERSDDVDKLPKNGVDDAQMAVKMKNLKRKPVKPVKMQEQNADQNTIQEGNLADKKLVLVKTPDLIPKSTNKTNANAIKLDSKVAENDEIVEQPKHVVANQLPQPNAAAQPSDVMINKDAIQNAIQEEKENQRDDNERTRLLAEVKDELVKQTKETQQLMLEQIHKISQKIDEKMDKIEMKKDDEKQQQNNKLDTNKLAEKKVLDGESEIKNLLVPPVPLVKLLAERKQLQENLSDLNQAVKEVENKIPLENLKEEANNAGKENNPKKLGVETQIDAKKGDGHAAEDKNENKIGRDLLSAVNDPENHEKKILANIRVKR